MNNYSYEWRTPMDKRQIVNEETVEKVSEALPPEEILYDVAELFKVFGDTTRIKIICALFEVEEMCVYDLAATLNMTQFKRDGKMIYYSLDDDHVKQIFDAGYKHIIE